MTDFPYIFWKKYVLDTLLNEGWEIQSLSGITVATREVDVGEFNWENYGVTVTHGANIKLMPSLWDCSTTIECPFDITEEDEQLLERANRYLIKRGYVTMATPGFPQILLSWTAPFPNVEEPFQEFHRRRMVSEKLTNELIEIVCGRRSSGSLLGAFQGIDELVKHLGRRTL